MRERLGWLTNCSDEQACPQNWLERAVTELPAEAECHVCGKKVGLVRTEDELRRVDAQGRLGAFPIVPPISMDAGRQAGGEVAGPRSGPGTSRAVEPEPMPRTGRAGGPQEAPRRAPRWSCTLASGDSVAIDRAEMVIGRSRTCDVVVPSAKVSRQHAKLNLQGGQLWIEDLGSANGVWHDGVKVTRTQVSNGDTYTISDETLLFEVR